MKQLLIAGFVFLVAMSSAYAQSPVLKVYLEMKDTLVNADGVFASGKAGEFIKSIGTMDVKTIPVDRQSDFIAIEKKLVIDAGRIAAAKDIDKQRESFANLSLGIYSLAKLVKLSNQPLYQDYCPMKKMYWLSSEKSIRNPYYGKMMLTCGNVTETINP